MYIKEDKKVLFFKNILHNLKAVFLTETLTC